jgi:nucleotide-binding universal stress UspA family protein
MAIKDILTIVDLAGRRPAASVAAELARRLDAHLTGLTTAHSPLIPASGIATASEALSARVREAWLDQARAADAAFQEIARLAGIRYESVVVDAPSDGYFAEFVRRSRLADLVVIGQEDPDVPEPLRGAMIEALLFEAGAPVLLVPYIGVGDIALRRALVAWDGSATAARAVRAGLSLLGLSDSVTVLRIGNHRPEESSDIAVYLDRHGLKVEVEQVPANEIPVADVLLNTVADRGFDWVVMGAYGHSRVREYLFGGATRDILGEMTVPVLMAH